ncbi:MAG: xanthine dehydrogenase family protein molybdopterin-binding subunit [Pedobacter sp.]|nr:MAG: xanthine dehydrogenase family protein molybdopterin-binding subunit [Pedobacter sp.]
MTTNRRSFLKTAGSLTVMFSLEYSGLLASAMTMNPELPEVLRRNPSLGAWMQVLANGSVRVFTGKVELGQGLCGAIAQVTAEELDLKVDQIEVVIADTRRTPNEGFTGGSFSTESSVLSIRYAAAAARRELMELAAAVLMVPAEDLQMADGKVSPKSGGRSLSFFALLEGKKLKSEIRLPLQLKPKEQYQISGKSVHREDFKQMVVGAEMYIQDLRFPGMVHARTISPPSYDARLVSLDEADLNEVAPVLKVIKDDSFIAVICEDEYQSIKAQQHLSAQAKWSVSQERKTEMSMPELLKSLTVATSKVKTAPVPFPGEAKTIKAAYYKPYVMHGAIAPSCAVARYENGLLEIWTHSQGAYPLRDFISRVVKIPSDKIEVTCIRGSGCYGHNGSDDAAAETALIAIAFPGRHVRLQWSREQEHAGEPYGTAMYMELEAVLAKDGRIAHFRNDIWSDAHYIRGNPGYLNVEALRANPVIQKANPVGSGGYRNADLYYKVPNQTVTANFFSGPLRTSNLRSLGSYANLFAVESFMDELAAQSGIDPFEFRIMHLEDKRAIEVLERLRQKVNTLPKEKNTGIGIGFSRYKNSAAYIAVAAQVKVHPSTFKITPVKLWAVVDVGEVISLDSVINQIEGGMIQATSWTLFESVNFEQQMVKSRNWASYPIIRFNDVPDVLVEIISRPHEKLQGVGEVAMCATPAAIANAIKQACGKRIRNLPVAGRLK